MIGDGVDEEAALTLEILDARGDVVRTLSSTPGEQERCEKGNEEPRKPVRHKYPSVKAGFNKWRWNLRSEDVPCIDNLLLHAGYSGPSVAPGRYTARLTLGEQTAQASFVLGKDPRSSASDAQIADWVETLGQVKTLLTDALQALDSARRARTQIAELAARHDDAELQALALGATEDINAWEAKITQLKFETYEDEDAWATMLDGQIRYLMDTIDRSGAPVTDGMRLRQADLTTQWAQLSAQLERITRQYVEPINQWAQARREPHVVRPLAGGN